MNNGEALLIHSIREYRRLYDEVTKCINEHQLSKLVMVIQEIEKNPIIRIAFCELYHVKQSDLSFYIEKEFWIKQTDYLKQHNILVETNDDIQSIEIIQNGVVFCKRTRPDFKNVAYLMPFESDLKIHNKAISELEDAQKYEQNLKKVYELLEEVLKEKKEIDIKIVKELQSYGFLKGLDTNSMNLDLSGFKKKKTCKRIKELGN